MDNILYLVCGNYVISNRQWCTQDFHIVAFKISILKDM